MSETLSALVSPSERSGDVPVLYIGLAGEAPRSPPARIGLAGTDRVDLGRGDVRQVTRSSVDDVDVITVTLADPRMSTRHARVSRVGDAWVVEDVGSKNGTWVGRGRIAKHRLADGDAIVLGHTALVFRNAGGDAPDLDTVSDDDLGLATLSPRLAAHFDELRHAAASGASIAIYGETGTGKELVARAVHARSGRPGAFVAVNCGALSGSLIEAELFGHKKGAFTGAGQERLGLVRTADGGTLFLDEVAELSAAAQTALLRVLQEREVVPIGADRPVKVDVRIVTATHKRLDDEVRAGRFRADLRARLLGVAIELPALRDRREDVGILISTLLDRLAPGRAIAFSAEAVGALYAYAWPLNIRELELALVAALAVTRQDRIDLDRLPITLEEERSQVEPPQPDTEDELHARLVASIARHGGNLAAVARDFGKDRTQIRRWMKRFGIVRGDDDGT
jgi:DNA-binding NtrC family response regulator